MQNTVLTIDQIREMLRDRKVNVVADSTGISRGTIYNILSGEGANSSTTEKLSEYLLK